MYHLPAAHQRFALVLLSGGISLYIYIYIYQQSSGYLVGPDFRKSRPPEAWILENPKSGCLNFAKSKPPEPVFPGIQLPES